MRDLIIKILKEEVSNKEYETGVQLMTMFTKDAQYERDGSKFYVFAEGKDIPLFYLTPETMYGRTLKYSESFFNDFNNYLNFDYYDFVQFMIEWSKTVLGERVNYVEPITPFEIELFKQIKKEED